MKCLLILFLFLLPEILFGQKEYKYNYRRHLISQTSTFTSESNYTLLSEGKVSFSFWISDNKGESIPATNVKIKSSTIDTTILSDGNGFVTTILPTGIFSITIYALSFSTLQTNILATKGNTKTTIKASLGRSNVLNIITIHSVRRLTRVEINKIVDNLSFDNANNELIKNKTCYVTFEI